MNYNEVLKALETSLYAYDINAFSDFFMKLIDHIEQMYSNSTGEDKAKLEEIIGRMFGAYQKKDYLYVIEIAKYEVVIGEPC